MTTLAPVVGSTRVIAVGEQSAMARGRAAEFRHRGLALATRPNAVDALLEVSREPESVVLVSTRMSDMPLVAFVDVIRSLAQSPVLLGIAPGCPNEVVSELVDHGIAGTVALPVTPSRLAHAVAFTRRPTREDEPVLKAGDLELDPAQHRVTWGGREVRLGRKEFDVLHIIMREHPRVIPLAEVVAELADGMNEQSVRVAAARVRAKCALAQPLRPPMLETVHRIGYRVQS